MALARLDDFEKLCRDQGVQTDPRIYGDFAFTYSSTALGPLDSAIAYCGNLLRVNPRIELADRLIDAPLDSDIGLKTLVAIVNASRKGEVPSSPDYSFFSGGKPLDCCSGFEDTMISSLESLQSSYLLGGDVIVDSNQNPILFRKPEGEPSALALRSISINYVPYPAGSALRVDTDDAYELDIYGDMNLHIRHPRVSQNGIRVLSSIENVVGATFLRLSAFAYDEADMLTLLPSEDIQRLRGLGCTSLAAMSSMIRQSIGQ